MTYLEVSPEGPWAVGVVYPDDQHMFGYDHNGQSHLAHEVRAWIEENYPETFIHEVGAAATLLFYDRGAQVHFRLRF